MRIFYLILALYLIGIYSVFCQNQEYKLSFDFYWSPSISQSINKFVPSSNYVKYPAALGNHREEKNILFLSNFGLAFIFSGSDKVSFGIGVAFVKRGGKTENSLIINYPHLISKRDSSHFYKNSTLRWYYNCLDFPISLSLRHLNKSSWNTNLKVSFSISYILRLWTHSKGVFVNDSSFTHKTKWDNSNLDDRLGFAIEGGYRFTSSLSEKTSFWFEPFVNYLITEKRETMPHGHLNVGIHFGLRFH